MGSKTFLDAKYISHFTTMLAKSDFWIWGGGGIIILAVFLIHSGLEILFFFGGGGEINFFDFLNFFDIYMAKPNERWCRFFGSFCCVSPLLTMLSSKCHNFFSIWFLSSLEKYVRQKFSLCLLSKKHWSLSLSNYFYCLFSKNWFFFCLKSRILVGNRPTKKCSKKWKVWMF